LGVDEADGGSPFDFHRHFRPGRRSAGCERGIANPTWDAADRIARGLGLALHELAQLATIYRDGQLIGDALAQAAEQANADRPQHEQQLAGVRADIQSLERKIDRHLQAFEDAKLDPDICQQRIARHHTRLQALRDQEADLAQTLAAHADTQPDTASLSRARRPTRPAHRHRQPRASQGAAAPPHQGHPRPRPAHDHSHLPRATSGSHNARNQWAIQDSNLGPPLSMGGAGSPHEPPTNSGRSRTRTWDLLLIREAL
jgi:hypothetical protein